MAEKRLTFEEKMEIVTVINKRYTSTMIDYVRRGHAKRMQ